MANELNVTLDTGQESYQLLKCKQNDIRTLVATLLDKGSPFSFTGYTGIDIRVKKADNTVYIQTLIPNSFTLIDNVLTVKLEQDITRVAGTAELEIMIKFGSDTITSFTFNLDVVASVIVDGAVASENTINLLEMIKAAWTPISNSPKGTYATLTALNAAYPNGDSNVYVIAADGTWRYWNGTTWANGGLYQSTGIADNSITYEKLDKTSISVAGLTGVATRLVQGTDFNTIYKFGPYDCWNAVNVPFQGWIKVFCMPSGDDNTTNPNLVTQIATGMNDHIGEVYVRSRSTENTWSAWLQLYSTGNKPTAIDVGLGNVPNVSTNNQTVTYTVASDNTNLTSGETISVVFGKIAKAISSLISHLADSVSHITSTERTNWNSASTNSHTHTNKTVLDNTTASYSTAEQTKLSGISTGSNKVTASTTNGNILIDNTETKVYDDTNINSTLGNKVDKIQGKSLVEDSTVSSVIELLDAFTLKDENGNTITDENEKMIIL